jgi:hypothetical protein
MIFDIKMDLTQKAFFVEGGHMTLAPARITNSSVVSRASARLAFLIAAHNDVENIACDAGNAYLDALCSEKVCFVAGPEFESRKGSVVKVVRGLFDLKSSGEMFNWTMLEMGFVPSTITNPDVYRRASMKDNQFKYYEYVLAYVDDVVLIILHNPTIHLGSIQAQYDLNPMSIGPPCHYLCADTKRGVSTGLSLLVAHT